MATDGPLSPIQVLPTQGRRVARSGLAHDGRAGSSPAAIDPRILAVQALMQRALHRKLPLRELAAATGLSIWGLCHLFRAQTGISPARHLKRVRLQRAEWLLKTSTLSVKEIAARVGLHDVAHFIADFRRLYGLTPSRYRLAGGNATDHGP